MNGPSGGEPERISSLQFTWMLLAIITSASSAFVPSQLIVRTGQDSWIAIVVAWLLDVGLAALYAWAGMRYARQTVVQYTSTALGPWLGKPLGLLFPLFFFLTAIMLLRSQASLIAMLFLPGTPIQVIALAAAAVSAYAAWSGLEVVGRASEVLVPLMLVGSSVVVGLVAPRLDPRWLQPVLEHGWERPLSGVPLVLGYLLICLVMGMFQAYQEKPQQALAAKFAASTLGSLLLTSSVFSVIALVGPEVAGASLFPELAISREISLADFLERLEAIWMMIHVGAGFLSMGVLLWASALGVAQTFGLPGGRPLVLPLALLLVPSAIWLFPNSSALIRFSREVYPWITIGVGGGVEALVALFTVVRGPGKAGGARPAAGS